MSDSMVGASIASTAAVTRSISALARATIASVSTSCSEE